MPACPHCGGALSREVSRFSTGPSGGKDDAEELGGSRVDDDRAQRAVEALGGKLDAIANGSDPREAAKLFSESTIARAAFGDDVVEHYLNQARIEVEAYDAAVTDWERIRGFERL